MTGHDASPQARAETREDAALQERLEREKKQAVRWTWWMAGAVVVGFILYVVISSVAAL